MISRLLNQHQVCIMIYDYVKKRAGSGFLLRHDIDTPQCIINLPALIEIERSLNVRSTTYVFSDTCYYTLTESQQDDFRALVDEGFHLGLHTRAHFQENPAEYLQDEIQRFQNMFGFPPATVTQHGENPRPKEYTRKRDWFCKQFKHIKGVNDIHLLNQFPYQGVSDAQFVYHNDGTRSSILDEKFLAPFDFVYQGRCPLAINTHPCYWQQPD